MTISLRERNKQAAMASIRDIACELMRARSFADVTVDEIAANANISPSTLYRYFGTKEALVLSAERPAQLVERVARDSSDRSNADAFIRAANKVWEASDLAGSELALIDANPELRTQWERQLLDQRDAIADVFALRREAKSTGLRDHTAAAACLAVLTTVLAARQRQDNPKPLDKLLTKHLASICK